MSQHHDFAKHALPLQLNINLDHDEPDPYDKEEQGIPGDAPAAVPSICGMPLKYVSLVTLAVQNALLTLIMHYSRVSTPVDQTYSAGTAVLLTEVLKGTISLLVAFSRLDVCAPTPMSPPRMLLHRLKRLAKEVFRADCWKLSIPAILYVVQNNLQFVAVSNLEAATFQVSYQMKILTTAAFSVALLRKKLAPAKWASLFLLALGVGVVQIQNTGHSASGGSGAEGAVHEMNPFKGFMAVIAACFTSGLAGVYFEMVLKNTQADLWVRNVQLSLFSLLPALVPILLSSSPDSPSLSLSGLFAHFGPWAWATVAVQVLGGLLTALVIKYADNILKGFATSLSIVLAFLASAALFGFHMSPSFLAGASIVLAASWMYNQPDAPAPAPAQASALSSPTSGSRPTSPAWAWGWRRCRPAAVREFELAGSLSRRASTSSLASLASLSAKSYPGSPIEREVVAPLLGLRRKQDDAPAPGAALAAGGALVGVCGGVEAGQCDGVVPRVAARERDGRRARARIVSAAAARHDVTLRGTARDWGFSADFELKASRDAVAGIIF
ncbi:hypothetical protein CERSUDRAFT_113090, partial [Gelatoporia subvermispora B]